jgi:hypothetical protein
MVFLIDLPRLEDNGAASLRPAETRFSKDLSRFLSAAGVDDKMVNSLRNYDFSATADIGFVYSMYVCSYHHGETSLHMPCLLAVVALCGILVSRISLTGYSDRVAMWMRPETESVSGRARLLRYA